MCWLDRKAGESCPGRVCTRFCILAAMRSMLTPLFWQLVAFSIRNGKKYQNLPVTFASRRLPQGMSTDLSGETTGLCLELAAPQLFLILAFIWLFLHHGLVLGKDRDIS